MSKSTTQRQDIPADGPLDPEVLAFRQQFDDRSPLDEIVREGARRMLQAAIDAEVDIFIEDHQHCRDESGRRLVVKNGSLPTREILTGAGSIAVQQGRVRDNAPDRELRVEFSPSQVGSAVRTIGIYSFLVRTADPTQLSTGGHAASGTRAQPTRVG